MDGDAFFASALASLPSAGGRIALEPATYYFDDDLVIRNRSVMLIGTPATRLHFSRNKGLRLENADRCVVDTLSITGAPGSDSGQLIGVGQFTAALGTNNASFVRVAVDGGYRSVWLQNSSYTEFTKCRFTGATGPE